MKTNLPVRPIHNHEGVVAKHINPELQLRRSILSCMLWEDEFYEDGQEIAARIRALIPLVEPSIVSALAILARTQMKLRHVPLLIAREMARLKTHRILVAYTLTNIIQRADELSEFVAIYWKEKAPNGKKQPLSAQVKRGLAAAFQKFSAYDLAKYNRDGAVKLRDVLFLCHAKPKDAEQEAVWKQLVDGTLPVPDTWEVALSVGGKDADKKAIWTRLLLENKLGALALIRNLRNMTEAGVNLDIVRNSIVMMKTDRVLPFRFIAASRHAPGLEPELEAAMFKCLGAVERLPGRTVLLVDTSPSMAAKLSGKSDLTRKDAAFGLAILLREICETVEIWAFSTDCRMAPARRGFALGDAIERAVPSNGTLLGRAISIVSGRYDRLIVITDEETQDPARDPDKGTRAYLLNVASNKNGIGYGAWVHFDGFSEKVVDYIRELEKPVQP